MSVATDTTQRLLELLEEQGAEKGIDIVDLEVVGTKGAPIVRIRIDWLDQDKPGISLDDVAQQTYWISEYLDEHDPLEGSYTLEVSSPGLARPLRRPRDFQRFAGQTVSVKLKDTEGRRRFTGKLLGCEDGQVSVDCEGETISFDIDEIQKCKLKPEFDF